MMLRLAVFGILWVMTNAFTNISPKPTYLVPDVALCKTGYYQLPDQPCCRYFQCLPETLGELRAYNRSCPRPLKWNSATCTCDYSSRFIPEGCVDSEDCWDDPVAPTDCPDPSEPWNTAKQCCEKGVTYNDHSSGFGRNYSSVEGDPTMYEFCGELNECPYGLTFSVQYCACDHKKGGIGCLLWNFDNPSPLVDVHQNVLMTPVNCSASNGQLNCPGTSSSSQPGAEIYVLQKAYLGVAATFFGRFNSSGNVMVMSNESPGNAATVSIELVGQTLIASFRLPDDSVDTCQVTYNFNILYDRWFVLAVDGGNVRLAFGDNDGFADTLCVKSSSFNLVSNKCPLGLGFQDTVYKQFGFCRFAWTQGDIATYMADPSVIGENPYTSSGSWNVFDPWPQ
ncbi:unnamed protein product [Owenia fusiformis]|uniref:Uncharacterized protein n=1 Tax=Owenia fusiformis TaxID=6347 RepID=A0A8J1XJG6_OWEFU|nr:unnamed protein product [Owenia fusiformis]